MALSGFIKSAIKWASGINWVNISIRFAMSVLENRVIPVKLPPGWLLGLQTHRALLRELTRPVVRAAQASMPTGHGASASKNAITWLRRSCFLTTTFSAASIP